MSGIRIYVTHRIDKKSVTVNNPLYYNIRCGAVFDNEDSLLPGDNTGDNISERRKSFCELTTQYWAWKNEKDFDYYGFGHYRRYLSFSDEQLEEDLWGNVIINYLNQKNINKLCLHEKNMTDKIYQYDLLIGKGWDTRRANIKSVREQYNLAEDLDVKDLDLMIDILNSKYPEFSNAAKKYLEGTKLYSCNLFIMKKDLFNQYSEWLFDLMFEFEKQADISLYSEERYRTVGHLAERLAGIYYTYLMDNTTCRIAELQTCVIMNTNPVEKITPVFNSKCIPIVLASNNAFAPMLGVCLKSIVLNSSEDSNYDIVIFNKDISLTNQKEICDIIKGHKNFSVRFLDISQKIEDYDLRVHDHISVETYFRFLIQDIMSEYKKVIYLDCDIIVKADLAELYAIDMGNNVIAASKDADFIGQVNHKNSTLKKYAYEKLKLKNPYNYFQAGVLMFNIEELNREYKVSDLLEFAQKDEYKYMDQDILNILFENKVKYFDLNWNLLSDCAGYRVNNVIKFAPMHLYEEYLEARKNPYIIHYAGYLKPWHNPHEDFAYEFWNVARQTSYYEKLLFNMHMGAMYHHIGNKKNKRFFLSKDKLYRVYDKHTPKSSKRRRLARKVYSMINQKKW